ncbi:MAG: hypothetical protein APR54_01085 [Candidatus Cloacimonas sp. SDB]|jgi:Tol biopolymer transport system component|nr:MAG: hypothetical protein APR54_01085 [Candidatus Cloacimonas sp. SDB]
MKVIVKFFILLYLLFVLSSCYKVTEPSYTGYLSIINSDGSNYSRLSSEYKFSFSISPNEEYIVGEMEHSTMWIMNTTGEIEAMYDFDLSGDKKVSFSADSEYFYFSSSVNNNSDIYSLNVIDGNVVQFTDTNGIIEASPKLNQTNNLLLYTKRYIDTHEQSIVIRDLLANTEESIISDTLQNGNAFLNVSWSQDKIIYNRLINDIGIFSINSDGTENTKIIDLPIQQLSVKTGSSNFLYIYNGMIYNYDLLTGSNEELTFGRKAELSSDGSKLAFITDDFELAIFDISTGTYDILKHNSEISEIDISDSGNKIIFYEEIEN